MDLETKRENFRVYVRNWRLRNPERNRAIQRKCAEKLKRDISYIIKKRASRKIYARKNKTKYAIYWKEYHRKNIRRRTSLDLRRKYGITIDKYEEILSIQGGGCAICGTAPSGKKRAFAVDHDHSTGKVRGILCLQCNWALSRLELIPDWDTKAKKYLNSEGEYGLVYGN